jgi:O-antigen ligase
MRPYWGVLIIVTAWFVEVSTVPKLVGAVLLIPLGLSFLRDRGIWVLQVPQIKVFLAIGVLFLVSTWWSDFHYPITLLPKLDDTGPMVQEFIAHLIFLILFLYFITTRHRIELTVWLILGLIVIAAVTAIFPLAIGGGTIKRAAAAFSLAENPNRLAFISLFATSLLWFFRSYKQTRRWKALTLPLLFLLPATALATGSRSGFLQIAVLTALILKEQEGLSAANRARGLLFLGCIVLVVAIAMPTAQLVRATTFSPTTEAVGGQSLINRINRISIAIQMIADNPFFGLGIGNFRWMKQALYSLPGEADPHNSYLWALTAGGIGVLALYLLLFYITYRMLRQLERAGPRELLWLSKGLKVNLILFLVFSAFADFWLSDFLYLIVGLTIAMTYLWKRQELRLAQIPPHPQLVPR